VVIDDQLMQEALEASGLKSKREVVELGLRTLVRLGEYEAQRSREERKRKCDDSNNRREGSG
jgi:Arc/MetJ family transcription regulator